MTEPAASWTVVRKRVVAIALLVAAAALCGLFVRGRPPAQWLLASYGPVLVLATLFVAGCTGTGLRLGRRFFGGAGLAEGFLIGSFVAAAAVFFAGLLDGLGTVLFMVLPLALLAFGASALRDALARSRGTSLSAAEVVALIFGGAALLLLLLTALAPDNLNFDARWYHLGLAEEYVATGRIFRTGEGRVAATYGQWVTYLDTWAFCWPEGTLAQKVVLCLSFELVFVVAAAAMIPRLCRLLRPDGGAFGWAWALIFLFPGFFVYDTGIMGGADHAAMAWGTLGAVGLLELSHGRGGIGWPRLVPGAAALVLAKHTALLALVPLLLGTAWVARAAPRATLWRAGVAGLLLTAPLWLRNALFYGDPVYPTLARWLPDRPWHRDAPLWVDHFVSSMWAPKSAGLERVIDAAKALVSFHSDPGFAWSGFHGATPAFGSLFSASVLVLLFLGRGFGRTWWTVGLLHLGVLVWFLLSHQERYLVVLVPCMAAVVAVVLGEAWSRGGAGVRFAVVTLVAVQVLGALELPFLPTHRGNGERSPLGRSLEYFEAHYRTGEEAIGYGGDWHTLGTLLPPGAVVVPHGSDVHLGLAHRTVSDSPTVQFAFSYGELGSYEAIDATLRGLGVTHLLWHERVVESFYGEDSLAGEVLFRGYARLHAPVLTVGHGWTIAALPTEAPATPPGGLLIARCEGGVEHAALYPIQAWSAPAPEPGEPMVPRSEGEDGPFSELVARAAFVAIDARCGANEPPGVQPLGAHAFGGLDWALYARR